MGIEPTYSAWKAEVLPLNYTRVFRAEDRGPGGEAPKSLNHLSRVNGQSAFLVHGSLASAY